MIARRSCRIFFSVVAQIIPSSLDLIRASTPLGRSPKKDVDGRDEPGHDEPCEDERGRHDRLSDIARTGGLARDYCVGGVPVSAAIIPFVLREKCESKPSSFPAVAFRPAIRPDDLTMDHVDTAPCEYVRPEAQPGEPGDA
jgi:hypothetical protein